MDKNLSSVKTVNGNEAKERSPETARLLSVLKYLCLAAIIIVAAMLLFVFFSSPIKGALDGVIEKAGIEPLTEAPVAYAWTSPSSSDHTYNSSEMDGDKVKLDSNKTTFQTDFSRSTFSVNFIHDYISGNAALYSATATGVTANASGKYHLQVLYYWDIELDDRAQKAIANGQIYTLTVNLSIDVEAARTATTIAGNMFLCAAGGTAGSLDGMNSSFLAQDTAGFSAAADPMNNEKLEITLTSEMRVIRFGVYADINTDALITRTLKFGCPQFEISVDSIYSQGKFPQIKFAYGGAGTEGGTINGHEANKLHKANYSTSTSYSGTVNLTDVSVTVNPGYFFGGWGLSGGEILGKVDGDYVSKKFSLSSGAYLNQSSYGGSNVIVLTAYFYKIDISYTGTKNDNGYYTYMQQVENGSLKLDEEGLPSPVAQGPVLPTIKETCPAYNNSGTAFVMYSGNYNLSDSSRSSYTKNGTNYYYGKRDSEHSYSSINMPGDAGTYTFFFGVFLSGSGESSENCLGYYYETFIISRVSLWEGTVTGSSIDGETYTYTGRAITPTLTYVDFTYKDRPYRIHVSDENSGFASATISYTDNIYASEHLGDNIKAKITVSPPIGNFSGSCIVSFTIDRLQVSSTNVNADLSSDIAKIYKTVYTGFYIRPNVLVVEVQDGNKNTHVLYANEATNEELNQYYYNYYYIYEDEYGKEQVKYKYRDENGKLIYAVPAENNNIASASISKFTIKTENSQAIYYNNIEVSKNTAYFEIDVTGNLTGTISVYFDIVQLNLNDLANQFPGASISITATYEQPEADAPIYNGSTLTPVPTVASITLMGIPHYRSVGGEYRPFDDLAITYYFVNKTPQYDENDNLIPLPAVGWNGYFVNPAASDYTNNTNVTRDASGNVQTGASVTLTLSSDTGSVIGSCTTTFKILPFDLSGTTSGGAANSNFAPIADVTYSGEPLEPAFNFYANGISGSTQKLLDNEEDYGYVYS